MKKLRILRLIIEAKKCAKNLSNITEKESLVENIIFLQILEQEYAKLEHYEFAEIIKKRIKQISSILEDTLKARKSTQI
ncbi:MAG: hypothetical protein HRT72_08530 [Flavobacteriales bacterium]|nr:hypothetical protein [Flavobacteriales bacterium]